MKKVFLLGFLIGLLVAVVVVLGLVATNQRMLITSVINSKIIPRPKPLLAYTYENLRNRTYYPSEIVFEKPTATQSAYSVWQISYQSDGKRVSGLVNLPVNISTESAWTKPVIILIHGFADQKYYYPGYGSDHIAAYLAGNGYVTISPDLLGYATSDPASKDSFEERFQTYTTVLNLIASVCAKRLPTTDYRLQQESQSSKQSLQSSPSAAGLSQWTVDCRLGIWGHSNGGQIALSILEITGKKIPTVLWNPVSTYFPYSILYFSPEFDDRGKSLRLSLADFEADYDIEKYSLTNYFDWINGKILLQQGLADQEVPPKWSDDLNKGLATRGKELQYKTYPGNDHNMLPNWNSAAADALKFFKTEL